MTVTLSLLKMRCWELRHVKGRQQLEECDAPKSTLNKSLHTGNAEAGLDVPWFYSSRPFIAKHKIPGQLCHSLPNYSTVISKYFLKWRYCAQHCCPSNCRIQSSSLRDWFTCYSHASLQKAGLAGQENSPLSMRHAWPSNLSSVTLPPGVWEQV